MRNTTVKKVSSAHSPKGEMGQKYLASGVAVSMRLWKEEPGDPKPGEVVSCCFVTDSTQADSSPLS